MHSSRKASLRTARTQAVTGVKRQHKGVSSQQSRQGERQESTPWAIPGAGPHSACAQYHWAAEVYQSEVVLCPSAFESGLTLETRLSSFEFRSDTACLVRPDETVSEASIGPTGVGEQSVRSPSTLRLPSLEAGHSTLVASPGDSSHITLLDHGSPS